MTDKMPWMPFYGSLFYEDESVALMEPAEEAIYLRLLWRQWREGSLPADHADLERLARGTVTARVLELLPIGEDGRRRNAHMEEKRVKHQETQAKYAERGRKARAVQAASQHQAGKKPATSQPDAIEVRRKKEEVKESVRALRASPGRRTDDGDTWLTPYAKAWEVHRGAPQMGLLAKWLRPIYEAHGPEQSLVVWVGYLESCRGKDYCKPADFAQNYEHHRRIWGVEIGEDGTQTTIPSRPIGVAA